MTKFTSLIEEKFKNPDWIGSSI